MTLKGLTGIDRTNEINRLDGLAKVANEKLNNKRYVIEYDYQHENFYISDNVAKHFIDTYNGTLEECVAKVGELSNEN